MDEAKELCQRIGGPGSDGAEARQAVITALVNSGRFDEAQEVIQVIESRSSESSTSALREFGIGLARAGQLDQAREVADKIGNPARFIVLGELTVREILDQDARAQSSLEEVKALSSVVGEEDRLPVLRKLALALMEKQNWGEAYRTIGEVSLETFFETLRDGLPLLEKLDLSLLKPALAAATATAGWVDPNWRKLHKVLE